MGEKFFKGLSVGRVKKIVFVSILFLCFVLEIYTLSLNFKVKEISKENEELLSRTSQLYDNNIVLSSQISNASSQIEEIEMLKNGVILTSSQAEQIENSYVSKTQFQKLVNEIKQLYKNQERPDYLDGVESHASEVKQDALENTGAINNLKNTKEDATKKENIIKNNTPDDHYLSTLGLDNEIKKMFDELYPVGSIYCTIGDSLPLYGDWELLEEGRVLWSDENGGEILLDQTLPNIKGNAGYTITTNPGGTVDGPFYHNANRSGTLNGNNDYNYFQTNMDLSRISSIYQDDAGVIPAAIAIKMYKRVN